MMSSLRERLTVWLRNTRPTSGRSPRNGIRVSPRLMLSSIRPPIISVSSSCIPTVVSVSLVEICGTPLRIPVSLLTTGCKETVMKLPELITGVMSSVTPVWKVCSWVVAIVPGPPPVVVRMEMLSPARTVAVRPDTVVIRGSAKTLASPF